MGLGQFGGGAGVVRFLLERGALVTVSDQRSLVELGDAVAQLPNTTRLTWHLGCHQETDFIETDLVVVSPAVKPEDHYVQLAQRHGIPVTSEIGLFWERCQGRIAGVTGTNGKSTVATLLHDCLNCDGNRVWLGGNIGGSLLNHVDTISQDDWVVLELSSFQLTALNAIRASPQVAVITNFSPNHLDWHSSLADYRHAKQTILRWQQDDDIAVLGVWDEVREWPVRATTRIVDHSIELPDRPRALRGPHHDQNVATVVTTAREVGVSEPAIRHAIAEFSGLPHRMEFVGRFQDRIVYNDSAATTPESTVAAISSLGGPKVVLVGGADKGVSLTNLASALCQDADVAILMGDTTPMFKQLLTDQQRGNSKLRMVVTAETFSDAVREAFAHSSPGDTVLLSPGCSSYGWFSNFVERGDRFIQLIRELSDASSTSE